MQNAEQKNSKKKAKSVEQAEEAVIVEEKTIYEQLTPFEKELKQISCNASNELYLQRCYKAALIDSHFKFRDAHDVVKNFPGLLDFQGRFVSIYIFHYCMLGVNFMI